VSRLRDELSIEVLEHDERLTSVLADQGLLAGGARRGTRRALRDAVAAQVMLQSYLDARG
jgi:RNase H-fold protein (predicted Holliday junction resolvase)